MNVSCDILRQSKYDFRGKNKITHTQTHIYNLLQRVLVVIILTLLPGSPCSPFSPFTPPGGPYTQKSSFRQVHGVLCINTNLH